MVDSNLNAVLPRLLGFTLPGALNGAIERVFGIRGVRRVYDQLTTGIGEQPIAEKLLQFLEVEYSASERDFLHIPRRGPAVMVVNHPFGVLEGAVLATLLSRVRSDVKFLANGILMAIPEIRELLIPVDPMGHVSGTPINSGGMRKAIRFVEQGGLLVVFPAGEVSHFQWKQREVTDPQWSAAVARMLEMAGRRAPDLVVVPAYVGGANSVLFQLAGLLHPGSRTAMLARELLNKRRANIEVRAGSVIPISKVLAIPSNQERIDYLRWRVYLLAERNGFKPRTNLPIGRTDGTMSCCAAQADPELTAAEVARLAPERLLDRSGSMAVYLAPANEIPTVLAEIGRLREITFRAAGEGTGNAVDLDEFDQSYLHLFAWSEKHNEVIGAYRLAATDSVRGLYTATLFQYSPAFLDKMGPALELGRSFIRPQYQKSFSALLLLWKGIGKYVAQNPRYKVLFGAVSISTQYQSISRRLIVSFLERHALLKEWAGLVRVRNAFRARQAEELPQAVLDLDDLASVVSDIEPGQPGVPVLLRQYLKLGGKLLGFNVDPNFSKVLDGLILVDLTKTEPKLLERYLGIQEAASFLAYQRGRHGTW